jgi:hypothetical protein
MKMNQPNNSHQKVIFELLNDGGFPKFTIIPGGEKRLSDLLEEVFGESGFLTPQEIDAVCGENDPEIPALFDQNTLMEFKRGVELKGYEVEVVSSEAPPPEDPWTKVPNKLIEDLARADDLLNHRARILLIIARATEGFHRKWVTISAEELGRRTGIPTRGV